MKKGTIYHALDISGGKIAALCGSVDRTGEIIDICCSSGRPSGIKNGTINELGLLAESVANVLNKLVALSGEKIKSLYTCIQGPHIKSSHSVGILPLSERSNKIVTSSDIAKVNQQAYSLGLNIEERVLHRISQEYVIDSRNRVLDPTGLYGHKLEGDLLIITASSADVENLISAIDRAGCKVRSVVSSGYAASLTVLPQEAKLNGCCLIDIGFDTTQMLVFKDGLLRGFESFSLGSGHITEALAFELKLPYELAESIKVSYGNALPSNINPEQEVLVRKEQGYRSIKRSVICSIIEKQLQELCSVMKERLGAYRKTLDFPGGIVVSGKTALLEGLLESFEANFSLPAHLAKIENPLLTDLTYATALGLIKYAASLHPQINIFKLSSYGNILEKIIYKSKEIYHEYF